MFNRITIHEAKRRFNRGEPVVFCPCNLRPGYPWSPHCAIHPAEWLEEAAGYVNNHILWKGSVQATAWDLAYSNWAYYNASHEAGYYAAYYVEA